ncbi:hypothetical protein GW17_00005422 [Ensete ventricosum]|nr:hypothetical protein GW17_00005422 [Ensete ventricosum]
MNYENPSLVLPCYLQLSEAARLAYGVTKAELDDFLMYEFKVKRCAKAYPHQWMTCPFAHRGEKARRRDPRRFPNHGIPCPEFRQTGACRRGQKCEFAHGVFEFWLHPTRYRTRMCISGPACRRKICFFAHTVDELRPEGLGEGGGGVPAGVGKLAEGTSAGRPEERGEEFAEPDLRLQRLVCADVDEASTASTGGSGMWALLLVYRYSSPRAMPKAISCSVSHPNHTSFLDLS